MALAVDAAGNIVVADTGNPHDPPHHARRNGEHRGRRGRKSGSADGAAVGALRQPRGAGLRRRGPPWWWPMPTTALRLVGADGAVSTLSGAAGDCGSADGPAAGARLSFPGALALASDGVLYVADRGNARCAAWPPTAR